MPVTGSDPDQAGTALVLVVDDDPDNRAIVERRLRAQSYQVITAEDGVVGLERAREIKPDLVILDVMMPRMDGLEVLKHLRSDAALPFMPVIMLTAKGDLKDVVVGLDLGADDYLVKPIEQAALLARVRAMLRLKAMQEEVTSLAARLAGWNKDLTAKVETQVGEIERMQRLRRFLSPQVADLVLASGQDALLDAHRREVTVVFCDLRGFTQFAETAEPEEVISVIGDYHAALGPIINAYEGTLERFTGDGLLVFFNDPVPCPNPAERAVRLAVEARAAVEMLIAGWERLGIELGFGVGIAKGYATLGKIGFDGRYDYAAIGTVTNLGARLCGEARHGQIVISQKVAADLDQLAELEPLGALTLKGFHSPIRAHNVVRLK